MSFIPFNIVLLLSNLQSPEMLQYIGTQLGIQLSLDAFKIGVQVTIARIASGDAIGNATQALEKIYEGSAEKGTGGITEINSSVISGVLADAVAESTASTTAKTIFALASESIEFVAVVYEIVQMLGMFVDLVDPEGYNQMLDNTMISKIKDTFDIQMNNNYLSNFGSHRVPVEFLTDIYLNSKDVQNKITLSDNDLILRTTYVDEYLHSLKVNSVGEEIIYPDPSTDPSTPVTTSDVVKLLDDLSLALADENIVVAAWIKKHWIIVIVIVILIVILLFTI